MKEHTHVIGMHGAGSELILGEAIFMHTEQSRLPYIQRSSGTSPLLGGGGGNMGWRNERWKPPRCQPHP